MDKVIPSPIFTHPNVPSDNKRDHPPTGDSLLDTLVVYDPYYCKGRVSDILASLGCARNNVINRNRDFYADVAAVSA